MEDKLEERDNYSNLNRNNKWLGIIDYKSLIILLLFLFLVWSILGLFIENTMYRVYILVIVSIPLLGLFYANKSEENLSNVLYVILRYLLMPKVYVYNIETNKPWLK